MPVHQQISGVVWGLAIGTAMIIVVWAIIRGGWFRKPGQLNPAERDLSPEPNQPVHDFPEGITEAHGPVPLVVRITIVSFLVWAVIYVILFARAGFTFSS